MSRANRYQYLLNAGFTISEAKQLSKTSRTGLHATYFQQMVRSRRGLFTYAKRKNWTEEQYHNYIRDLYVGRGCIKIGKLGQRIIDVWRMLRWYEERAPREKDDYTSPWVKKVNKGQTKRREGKKTLRTDMIKNKIKDTKFYISKTKNPDAKDKLESELRILEHQLTQLEKLNNA